MRECRKFFRKFGLIFYLLPPTLLLAWEVRHFARQDGLHRFTYGLAFIILCFLMLIGREMNRLTERPRKRRAHHRDEAHREPPLKHRRRRLLSRRATDTAIQRRTDVGNPQREAAQNQ